MRVGSNLFRIRVMGRNTSSSRAGRLRIIGGRWRGRRISLPAQAGIRPTGDRIRETLFNWLAPIIAGARCLDLFAGSGALGLEALSRGAGETVFVERESAVADQLEQTLEKLDCRGATVVRSDALQFLRGAPTPFDIVFVDPPFGKMDLGNLCTLLERGWLSREARIFVETSRSDRLPELPPGWTVAREKTAGQVRFALARRA